MHITAGMSIQMMETLWNINIALTAMFTCEVIIKLVGLGFWTFIQDGFNVFDFLIVAIALVEIALVASAGMGALR
jgi:hypothetical protein